MTNQPRPYGSVSPEGERLGVNISRLDSAETMVVEAMSRIHAGFQSPYEPADLDLVKQELTAWSDWALHNPAMILPREDQP